MANYLQIRQGGKQRFTVTGHATEIRDRGTPVLIKNGVLTTYDGTQSKPIYIALEETVSENAKADAYKALINTPQGALMGEAIVELTGPFANGVSWAVDDSVYADADGNWTNVAGSGGSTEKCGVALPGTTASLLVMNFRPPNLT